MSKHKTIRHFEEVAAVHELTFSCYRGAPLLRNDTSRSLLARSITAATERHAFDLIAFVFMPEHVHLLVLPRSEESRIFALLSAIKRPFSYRLKQRLIQIDGEWLNRLTVHQRPGVKTFRCWQEGPGYDRNLESLAAVEAAIDYIHLNPVRRKLCHAATDWRWSSAGYYHDPNYVTDAELPRIDGLDRDTLT